MHEWKLAALHRCTNDCWRVENDASCQLKVFMRNLHVIRLLNKLILYKLLGYYEWQRNVGPKQTTDKPVFFLHSEQADDVEFKDKATWTTSQSPKLMYLAGLFDVWHDEFKNSIFSYSILTFESDFRLQWLHDRTPAILESEIQIEKWLNFNDFNVDSGLSVMTPPKNVHYFRVTNYVNSSKNKSEKCIKPFNS